MKRILINSSYEIIPSYSIFKKICEDYFTTSNDVSIPNLPTRDNYLNLVDIIYTNFYNLNSHINNYINKGKLWEAFEADEQVVLLIDEIDKADIEFPNDLLQEIDRMEFYVYETKETVKAIHRPIVIITSNNEKELPDAFLRRCFFHYISFPDRETMQDIVKVHHPKIKQKLVKEALDIFFDVRKVPGLKKKPSTSELVDWLKLLMSDDLPD